MSEIYQEIFTGVETSADLRHAIARAVRTLREAMEKEDNRAVTAAHVRNLADIEAQALATAFALAEKTCTYWPTPGQIRELAGWSDEARSREALQWVFAYLEKHGVDGRPRGGSVRFGEDETGRRVMLGSELVEAAPEIPGVVGVTLAALGSGAVKQGLRYISQHPVVKGWDTFSGDSAFRVAERIEGQWMRCWLERGRKPARRTS
jgi:hypothetical protein